MKTFEIVIAWRMEKKTLIQAESLEEAEKKALKYEAHAPGNAIQGFYVQDSLKISNGKGFT